MGLLERYVGESVGEHLLQYDDCAIRWGEVEDTEGHERISSGESIRVRLRAEWQGGVGQWVFG